MPQSRKRFGPLLTFGTAVAAAGLGILWMQHANGKQSSRLVYETAAVSKGTIRKSVATSGPVRALVTVSVGSQLSGQIDEVNVDFNSTVKPGELLARVDAKTYAARVAQAKADLAAAQAARANQQAALIKAESILKLGQRTLERQQALAGKGFASTAVLDSATRDVEVGKAEITVAKAQIDSAEASIEQRKAQLLQAEIDLERTEIRSPIEGTVISRTVDPGQTVAASLQAPELFKIAQDLSRIRIEAQVNEADVGAVSEGNPATFTVDAYPDRRFSGHVTQVRLAATEINNVVTYTVIIEAENNDRRLFPGMTANVEIEAAKKDNILRIPNEALRYKARGTAGNATPAEARSARTERTIERLKTELQLSESQEAAARTAFQKMQEEMQAGGQPQMGAGASDPAAFRQRMHAALDQHLAPTLEPEQRRALEKWKLGRETTRFAAVYVLKSDGVPERRNVRTGLSDEQFTEVVSGELADGEAVIVRAREAGT